MRPSVHLLSGVALAGLLPEKHRRLATVAFAAAFAAVPDVDTAAILLGPEALYAVHRVMTHSVAGILAVSLTAALAVAVFWKKQRFFPALWLALVAQLTHAGLDMCTGYGVKLFWPFYSGWVSVASWQSSSLAAYVFFAALLPLLYRREIRRAAEALGFLPASRAGEAKG